MEKIFIETRYKLDCALAKKDINRLPEKVALVGPVQYLDCINEIKRQLLESKKEAVLPKLPHAAYPGQVLGCSISKISGVDAILFVGDGLFHPIAMLIKNKCAVFSFNPKNKAFSRLDPAVGKKHKKRIQGACLKFLSSRNIGILVSTKPGQNRLHDARKLSEKLARRDVKSYIFLSDNISPSGLQDFPFIDCFVNSACPRIFYDDYTKFPVSIVNIDDVMDI